MNKIPTSRKSGKMKQPRNFNPKGHKSGPVKTYRIELK